MKINDLIKKIRTEKGYSLDVFGEKIGFSKGYLHNVEIGLRPVSKKLFESVLKNFPVYEKELLRSYAANKLPDNIDIGSLGFKDITNDINTYSIKVYNFYSGGDGKVELKNPKEMSFVLLPTMYQEIINDGIAFEITGEFLKPYFQDGEILVFIKERFKNWYDLDEKMILLEVKGEFYIGRLAFDSGVPFLYSFNTKFFQRMEIDKEVKYIGKVKTRLSQDLENFKFE